MGGVRPRVVAWMRSVFNGEHSIEPAVIVGVVVALGLVAHRIVPR